MGIKEGAKKQYKLFDGSGDVAFVVYPLAENSNCLISRSGWRYTSKTAFNLSDKQLLAYKEKHNLFYDYELNMQMSIFDI